MINNYKQKWQMKLEEYALYHQRNIHFKYRYHDLEMQKNPFDMMIYMEIIWEVKPDVIIEIGGAGGGTALWLAHQLDSLGNGQLISIDINHGGFKADHERIIKITGDSTSIETASKCLEYVKGKTVLVIHDGSHKKEDIKKDFQLYGPFVSVDSYFIVEDGIMDVLNWKDHRTSGHDCGMVAGMEIAKENPSFIIDKEKEKYILTYNPQGYLKRVK